MLAQLLDLPIAGDPRGTGFFDAPLVAGQEEFDRIASILGDVLQEAWAELEKGRALAQA